MPLAAIDSFTPLCNPPEDFDTFWTSVFERLQQFPPQPTLSRQPSPDGELVYDKLCFKSLGNVDIAGYALTHPGDQPRPMIVHSHGYNSQFDVMLNWAQRGCNVVGIDLRGFGRSQSVATASRGYVLTGLDSPATSILCGAVCDLAQAVKVTRLLFDSSTSMEVLYGFSFGGAMAVMAGAWGPQPDLIVAGQPTLGWHSERLRLSKAGSSSELNRFMEAHPEQRSTVLGSLAYFDTLYFANKLSVPTIIGVGLDDSVVPSRSVIAIANHVSRAPLEVRILPVAHSDDPRESLWQSFDNEWMAIATHGLPEDFATPARQLLSIE